MLRHGFRIEFSHVKRFAFCRQLSTTQRSQNNNSNIYIFDRQAKLLQKERAALSPDVKLYDYIKEEAGARMVDRIYDLTKEIGTAAEIGCNRGFISSHDLADTIGHLYLCESSPTMLEQAEVATGLKVTKLNMDEEMPKFEENSLDMVVSSLSLHWVNDLPNCFKQIFNALKPDGVFMAVIFGGDTLYELRSALQLAELERKGGLSPHISPFVQVQDIGSLLNRAGYKLLTIDTDEMVFRYPSMFELMFDLKGMGESNAAFNRPLHLGRDVMVAAAAIYEELYKAEEGVNATFQLIHFIGWKPGPNQPKPLERGSANASFKDIGHIFNKDESKPKS